MRPEISMSDALSGAYKVCQSTTTYSRARSPPIANGNAFACWIMGGCRRAWAAYQGASARRVVVRKEKVAAVTFLLDIAGSHMWVRSVSGMAAA